MLGGLLGSIFMVPLLLERRFIAELSWLHDTYYYGRHFVYPSQFFSPLWGFGYSVEGTADGMSFQLGLLQVLGAAVGALAAFSRPARGERRLPYRLDAIFLVIVSLVTIFLMTPAAKPIWDTLPLVKLDAVSLAPAGADHRDTGAFGRRRRQLAERQREDTTTLTLKSPRDPKRSGRSVLMLT